MNTVMLTGYIHKKSELKTSAKGSKYIKNILTVPRDKSDFVEKIPFIAFKENAILIDKVKAGVTIEVKGTLHNNYDKEKKINDVIVYIDEVTLTDNIQDEDAFVEGDNADDMADDDLPF